jgi:pyruvate dehydrogenase E1 component
MYGENPENIYYYMTVYNEPIHQPEEPANLDVKSLLKGAYLYSKAEGKSKLSRVAIMASGVAMPWALKAQEILKNDYEVLADIYSVTSWNELRRDGVETERFNLLNDHKDSKKPFITELMKNHDGPIVAVSDWMKLVPEQLRPYLNQDFYTLGTDGWGVSDTRGALRRHFLVDAESIVVQSLSSLAKNGEIKNKVVAEAIVKYKLSDPSAADPGSTAGDS